MMRQFIGNACTNLAAGIVGLLGAFGLFVLVHGERPGTRKAQPAGEWHLLAETPSGARVWRVNHEKCIVPVVIVESANGSVAIR
jgi:hypothetical protein